MPATANVGDAEGENTMFSTVAEKPAAADKKSAQLNAEQFLFEVYNTHLKNSNVKALSAACLDIAVLTTKFL